MLNHRNESVLAIVDRRLLLALREGLGTAGLSVVTASGVDAGLSMFSWLRPALVVLDVSRLQENVYRLAREIRLAAPGAREPSILVLTGPLNRAECALFRRWAGVDEFLFYPFDEEEVVERARAMLGRSGPLRRRRLA